MMRLVCRMIAVLVLFPATLSAQEISGSVHGRLVSSELGPLAGAKVVATGSNLQGERRTWSAGDGIFLLQALPPGQYTLLVTVIGHRPLVVRGVQVQLGTTTGLGELTVEPAPLVLDTLEVTAPAATVDPVRTTIGARLTDEDFAVLPAQRDYKSAIVILPHANESYLGDPPNVGGSTGLENMYFVDGVNVTSEYNAASSMTLPYNFVRALEVKAGGYEAQYGKALGAVVNAVTYTGTNEFETALFGFFTNSAFTAEPKALPALREDGAVSYDVGARVSGPVLRDRLWFSTAYNPRIDRVEKEIAGLGAYDDRRTAHLFAGKLTWQTNPNVNVALSLFGDPTVHHAVAPIGGTLRPLGTAPYLRLYETGGVAGALRVTANGGRWLTLEGSVGYSRTKANDVPDVDTTRSQPLFADYVASTVSGYGSSATVTQGRTTLALRGTADVGRHTVVMGAEYEDARITATDANYRVDRYDTDQWSITQGRSGPNRLHNRLPTLYLQDAWRIIDRLTVNAGVRWSAQILSGASGSTAQKFPAEWQPRVGFNWQLRRDGMHRLFGSYGRFYQQIPLFLSSQWYVDYPAEYAEYSSDPRAGDVEPNLVLDATGYEEDWAQSIPDIDVENFDEVTLGYEGVLGGIRVSARGILRDLRSSFQWGADPESERFWVLGTPGKGVFSFLPPPKRRYTALEFSTVGSWHRLEYRASYVLSRNWGNYSGLFDSDNGSATPGFTWTLATPDHAVNTEGLLPNDRPHVVKLTAAYRTAFGLTPGVFFSWMSGTPVNDWGTGFGGITTFVTPRGSGGRTPSVWDLNVRLAYAIPPRFGATARVLVDLMHLGNPQRTVRVDQQHYYASDDAGNPSNPNPDYLAPIAYQPPMMARVGVELGF